MNSLLLSILRPLFFAFHQLKVWFRNIKLHWKIQLLTLFILLTALGMTYSLFHYSISIYDEELYSNSFQILNLSIQNIENEMASLLRQVSGLATDEIVQSKIREIENATSEYDQYTNRQALLNRLYIVLNKNKYIQSVNYISPNLGIASVGSDTSKMSDEKIKQLYDLAFSKNGKPLWVDPERNEAVLLLSPIREVLNLNLRPMGAIMVRISLDKLVSETMNIDTTTRENLYIYSGSNELYHSGPLEEAFQWNFISPDKSYSVEKNGADSYFIVKRTSIHSSWQYYYYIPYNNIFYRFNQLKVISFFVFILISIVLSFLAIYFSNSLTRPLTKLIRQMEQIDKIDFETSSLSSFLIPRKDEIGQLQQSFSQMLKQIETLVQEGYIKQLTIKDYEYRALQMQINPHFMYNTLDSIYWKAINSKQDDIATMIFSLSKLLRESIKYRDMDLDHLIPLRDEFQILNYYITIQQVRLRENFIFTKEITPEAYDCLLPKLILQPLVENSIQYGVEHNGIACHIHLLAFVEDAYLVVQIIDNGIGVEENLLEKLKSGEKKSQGSGIGLSNIISRLKIIYGEESGLSIENQEQQGAVVTLRIPVNCQEHGTNVSCS